MPSDGDKRGLSRREFLPRAAGGLVALGAAGVVGYELHPGSKSGSSTMTTSTTTTPATPSQSTQAGPFVTRTDLRPPPVMITHIDELVNQATSPRFICLAPDNVIHDGTPYQQGMMLLDRQGRLVWFQAATAGKPFDLKVQSSGGKPVLTWWEGVLDADFGQGRAQIADTTYRTTKYVSAGDGLKMDLHEFTITPSGTALCTAYQPTTADLSAVGGSKQGHVVSCHVQELDLATGKVLFDWDSLDHIGVDESYQAPPRGGLYDYFHMNSIQQLDDGNLLVSARNTWAIYKIDRSSGAVIWRLGGKKSDFEVAADARFAWQHHATWHGAGTLTLFDNSGKAQPFPTRGLLLSVNESAKTVSLTQQYRNPAGFRSGTLGSVQLLPDGRVFIGWGTQPYFSEFAADGTLLLDGKLAIGTRSYRAFTADLVAQPTEPPAIVTRVNPAGGFVVYVSWNGATEIAGWSIESGRSHATLQPVAQEAWTGFETAIVINSAGPNFRAIALDANGSELARSEIV